jgi:glucosamine--fructose-6-phosphate aminotransferase (isomerizing)
MTSRMRAEIEETPQVLERLLRDGRPAIREAAAAIRSAAPRFAVVVARGTSDHAGTYARYVVEARLGIPAGMAAPSVITLYRSTLDWRDVLLIAISQSGRSPDLVAVTDAARLGGALTLAVTNHPESPLAAAVDLLVPCHAGEELSVAATKTYVAELTALAAVLGEAAEDRELVEALPRLPEAAAAAVAAGEAWLAGSGSPVGVFSEGSNALVVGRGYNYATALEIALKLKEAAQLFADGYSTADLMHGPIAVARPGTPVLAFRPDGPAGPAVDEVLRRLVDAGSPTWVVGARPVPARLARSIPVCPVAPDLPEVLSPVPLVLPGQLLAEAVAMARGLDPDAPPGLSKVTHTV